MVRREPARASPLRQAAPLATLPAAPRPAPYAQHPCFLPAQSRAHVSARPQAARELGKLASRAHCQLDHRQDGKIVVKRPIAAGGGDSVAALRGGGGEEQIVSFLHFLRRAAQRAHHNEGDING